MNPVLPLPARIENITGAWLESALQNAIPGVRITQLKLDDTRDGTATKVRVQIESNDTGRASGLPSSLVIKGRFKPERQMAEEVYAAEVRFYREIQPHISAATPRCFFAGSDSSVGQHIVVLEDLDRRGVTFCEVIKPLGFQETAALLDNMARWHARFWKSPLLQAGGQFGDLYQWSVLADSPQGDYGRSRLVPEAWDSFVNLPRGIGLPRRFRDRERMAEAIAFVDKFCREADKTLLHGDHHLGNLYLDAEGKPGVLDWQGFSAGPWSEDVTYFMISALDIEDRRRWDRALMTGYLAALRDYGVAAPPSFDEAMAAFRLQIFNGLYYWLANPVEWQVEINNCAVVARFAAAALDHDSFGAIS